MSTSKQAPEAARRVYQGVWRILVDWFRVPQQPPNLPTHDDETLTSLRPSPKWLDYMMLQFYISWSVVSLMSLVGLFVLFIIHPLVGILAGLPTFAFFVSLGAITYLSLNLQFDTTWFVLNPRSIRLRHGIWTIHESTITFENVQNVAVSQGPLQRMFGIADVVVQTAGGGGPMPGAHGAGMHGGHVGLLVGLENAEAVRDLILGKLRNSTSAGLGDEHSQLHSHVSAVVPLPPATGLNAEQVVLLREIREQSRRLSERVRHA